MKDFFALKSNEIEVSGAPEVISVLPLGHVISSKGEFDVDAESYELMKLHREKLGVDLVIDYEHQTLTPAQAPAAGWVKELMLKDGCIAARVEWTPTAKKYLDNREYRYLSPVIAVRKKDGKATALHSLALTNTPAIEGMTPLVNSQNFEGGQTNMEIIKKLAELLGLGEDATEEQIIKALGDIVAENKSLKDAPAAEPAPTEDNKVVANKAVCELLGLKAGAPTEDVTSKIMELKNGTIGGTNVLAELAALKEQSAKRDAADAVSLALKAGKIAPAMKDWAETYALSDPKGFEAFVEKAPQVVPLGEVQLEDVKSLKNDKADAATLLVMKQLGVSDEDYQKFGKEN